MHRLQLVHKDIKPSNIVYSPSRAHYVLCDFGLSCPVPEAPGFKTMTNKEGTMRFMCSDMRSLGTL